MFGTARFVFFKADYSFVLFSVGSRSRLGTSLVFFVTPSFAELLFFTFSSAGFSFAFSIFAASFDFFT